MVDPVADSGRYDEFVASTATRGENKENTNTTTEVDITDVETVQQQSSDGDSDDGTSSNNVVLTDIGVQLEVGSNIMTMMFTDVGDVVGNIVSIEEDEQQFGVQYVDELEGNILLHTFEDALEGATKSLLTDRNRKQQERFEATQRKQVMKRKQFAKEDKIASTYNH